MTTTKTHPLNIVLVEDDDVDAKCIRRAFAQAKIANPVIRAIDGVMALETLRGMTGDAPDRPYLLLVDVNMPRMNGHEFVREIRADPALRDSIVFMLTTSSAREDIAQAYACNVAGYVVKERAGADLLALVDTLDAYWRLVEMPV